MFPNHLYEASSPILLFSLIWGISPIYWFKQDDQFQLKTSRRLKLLTFAYLCGYTWCVQLVFRLPNQINTELTGNTISSIGLVFELIGQIILTYIVYIYGVFKCPKIITTLEDLATIDSLFKIIGQTVIYKKIFRYQFFSILSGVIGMVLIAITQHLSLVYSASMPYNMWIIYYLPVVVVFTMEYQFSLMVLLIYRRFQMINKALSKMIPQNSATQSKNNKILSITDAYFDQNVTEKAPRSIKVIETLMQIHDSLVDIAEKLNGHYEVQILLSFTVQFVITVFSAFYMYYAKMILQRTMSALNWGLWALFSALEILHMTVSCHLATRQAKLTGIEIHKLLINSNDVIIKDKLMIFSQQVIQRPLCFTACGLFEINASLLFTIVGSAATYLLIMLQFQGGGETNCVITNTTA